jgi:uncharacterized protein (TIGR03435 family)
MLGAYLAKPVADETGLQGLYDFELTSSEPADAVTLAPSDPDGVSLITAIRDQLGLRLTAMRIPVETIVIDSATQPSPN